MDEVAELRQQLADVARERDGFRAAFFDAAERCLKAQRETGLLSKGIADSTCKLGITSEGVAQTGPHLLMLLGDMVGMVEALQARNAEFVHRAGDVVEALDGGLISASMTARIRKLKALVLAQSTPTADEQGVKS